VYVRPARASRPRTQGGLGWTGAPAPVRNGPFERCRGDARRGQSPLRDQSGSGGVRDQHV
jgi:hypothetical protein